jgi:hypothetical protein
VQDQSFDQKLRSARWMLLHLKYDLAAQHFQSTLARYIAQIKFNPGQLRIPAGQPGGGQWTNGEDGGNVIRVGAGGRTFVAAAEPYGGSLAGRTIEMSTDRPLCPRCETVLPRVGLQLGNPAVQIIDGRGDLWIMRDGYWVTGGRR